jgi:hypothetical protein
MTVIIKCQTRFDITETGIRNNFNPNRIPLTDQAGHGITNHSDWQRSRNQQRNWETFNQIIMLRTLPEKILSPKHKDGVWTFEFTVENPATVALGADPVGALTADAMNVPMIIDLDETEKIEPWIVTQGANVNTWFRLLDQ